VAITWDIDLNAFTIHVSVFGFIKRGDSHILLVRFANGFLKEMDPALYCCGWLNKIEFYSNSIYSLS
jgi:hypothetical protein